MLGNIFFDPDKEMVKWIIDELVQDKMVWDIGCGTGEFLLRLNEQGITKLIGVDPFTDHMAFMENRISRTRDMIHLFPNSVSDPVIFDMLSKITEKQKAIGFLCRPCHSHLLTLGTYDVFKSLNIPLYYIGLEKNLEMDLDYNDIPYMEVKHKGTSRENEKIYKLV